NLNKEVLKSDVERLTAWYYDNGYVTVRIDEPVVEREEDGIHIRVKVDEGPQFKVGKVRITGPNLPPYIDEIQKSLDTRTGETFSAGDLRDDVQKLSDRLSDEGYAFTTVEPKTDVHLEDKTVNVDFESERGKPVTIDRIEVTGNTKTRDYVIRREM